MGEIIRVFSGKGFSAEDIDKIIWTRKTFPKLPEYELACTICETLGWVSHSGIPKRKTCTDFIRQLASEGIIDLPGQQTRGRPRGKYIKESKADDSADALPAGQAEISDVDGIELEVVKVGPRLKLLRAYLKKYHMLGDSPTFGEQIQYFINDSKGRELGCMRFSAASWALEARDEWIGWTAEQKKERLFLVVNQSRYLIFPWVHVRNLSSRALSAAARRLPGDWLERYCYEPVLMETFVDKSFFKGTSYKSANWILVGQTKGRGRNDRHKECALSIKDIYVYPLRRDYREMLVGKKPYKKVEPDG